MTPDATPWLEIFLGTAIAQGILVAMVVAWVKTRDKKEKR